MQPKVLVIEDNQEMNENISEILSLAHYEVLRALNGKAGLALASEHKPDLILCDIMMPELDGYGVLHILRHNPETARIPLVFLTAKSSQEDFRTGMNLGADDYVTKPFNDLDLLKVVEIRLQKKEGFPVHTPPEAHPAQTVLPRGLEEKLFQKLTAERPLRPYKRRQMLYMEGQHPHALYLLVSGELKSYKSTKEGKEFITAFHAASSIIGHVPLLSYGPYTDSAQVISEQAFLQIIPRQELLNLLFSQPELAQLVMQLMATQIAETEIRMLELAYQSVRQKVAGALLKMQEMQRMAADSAGYIHSNRKDLAGLVGTATETLNRTLSDFREEGLIDISDAGIRLLDLPRLQRLHA
jgi:DNA-binding response OmpR family regulator